VPGPRFVLAGLESGPAVDLAAGALLAALGSRRSARPVLVGLDVPLWRLLYEGAGKAPRVIDPALHADAVTAEMIEYWSESVDVLMAVAVRPALDRWEGVEGSRPIDYATRLDCPLVLVLDARERGATAAAAVLGVCQLAGQAEVAGLVVVGAEDSPAGRELLQTLRRDVGLPLLAQIPPQLSEQFVRQRTFATGAIRTIGPKPPPDAASRLCGEAATYVHVEEVEEVAARRGFVPAAQRRLFISRGPSFGGVSVAVAWGPPLLPMALENIDVLQSAGIELKPLNIARDRMLPRDVSGLILIGQLDEEQIGAFAGNRELIAELVKAIDEGLPTMAFGGGALLLHRRLSDTRGRSHDLVGVVPADAEVIEWYDRPRYVRVSATRENPYDQDDNVLYELFDVEYLELEQESFAYRVRNDASSAQAEGFAVHRCLVTSLYPSFALSPAMADRFAAALRLAGKWE
jgi:cobyrinic acid a,c-diamide synthase